MRAERGEFVQLPPAAHIACLMTLGVGEMDEPQPLQDYLTSRSDEAFKTLVDQYVGLVYSACMRQLKDRHLAEDATQAVFLLLSQKAGALRQSHLSGWLLTTSRYACANIRKSEQRRQRREQVVAMNQNTPTEKGNDDLLDLLDEALCHLKSADREALMLRYLKEQSMCDVAAALGLSEEAARKRVSRSIEKLRGYFSSRGIAVTSTALNVVLSEQVRGAALTPIVRQSITHGILQVYHAGAHGTAASVGIAKGTKAMMLASKLKIAAAAAAITLTLGTGGWIISCAMADNAPAAPAVVPAAQPLVADLSTPQSALKSFFTAVASGDRTAAYNCLTSDPNRPPTLMDAMLTWNLAQNRLTHVTVQAFGGDGMAVQRMITLDKVAQILASALPEQIKGDTATIALNIPPQVITSAPASYQPMLRAWSNATLYLRKQGDQWKFDIDRSMRVEIRVRLDGKVAGPDVEVQIMLDNARSYDQIISAIRAGQYASPGDVANALEQAASTVGGKYRIVTMQSNVLPASAAK
jgi:RNA polymerase sigma factor (sigma-70 family)